MLGDILISALGLAISVFFFRKVLMPLPAIWHGDASRVPRFSRLQPQARTYLPYCLWTTAAFLPIPLCVGMLIVHASTGWVPPKMTSEVIVGVVVSAFPLMLLNVIAWAFNRPEFVITPAFRRNPIR